MSPNSGYFISHDLSCPLVFLIVLLVAPYFHGCHGERYAVEDLIAKKQFHWKVDRSTHFNFFFEETSWTERNISKVKTDAESALVRCLSVLQETEYPRHISYFIVNDRSRMKVLIDLETNGIASAPSNYICAIANDSVKALGPHEMFHVISQNTWGSSEIWIGEGMAVYADNRWWGQDLHALAKYLHQRAKLIPLSDLVSDFRSFKDILSYPESGSFMKYLYETYGCEKVKTLWKNGSSTFFEAIGKTLNEAEGDWNKVLDTVDTENIHYKLTP